MLVAYTDGASRGNPGAAAYGVRVCDPDGHEVARFGKAQHGQYRLSISSDTSFGFVLDVLAPRGDGPFPVVLNGDGCWCYVNDEVIRDVLGRGYLLARFNRVAIVPDDYSSDRTSGGTSAETVDRVRGAPARAPCIRR